MEPHQGIFHGPSLIEHVPDLRRRRKAVREIQNVLGGQRTCDPATRCLEPGSHTLLVKERPPASQVRDDDGTRPHLRVKTVRPFEPGVAMYSE
jgi:hypothetical protein